MNVHVGTPTDIQLPEDDAPASERRFQSPRTNLTEWRLRRLERDTARGYSINVKQVALAFAVEFVIIGLILVSQFVYAAEFPNPTQYKIIQALLFPIAFAMVELARVPLAIAVRTQPSWNIKLAALLGVACAVVVTSFSISQIGHLTFNPRLEAAHDKYKALLEAQSQEQSLIDQRDAAQALVEQRIKARDSASEAHRNVVSQLNLQPPQNCNAVTRKNSDGSVSMGQRCTENPALKPLKAELTASSVKVTEAEAGLKQAQIDLTKYDLQSIKEQTRKADADYRDAVYQSQLHSYTAMLFRKDPRDVTDGEVKTLEWYLILIPSIAAALSSTLIAMTAVRRIRPPKPQPAAVLPGDAAGYLFNPLLTGITKAASDAVTAAINGHVKATAPPGAGATNGHAKASPSETATA
jgi:hypothetical protein